VVDRDCAAILVRLREIGSPEKVAGMARYGINSDGTPGVSVCDSRGADRVASDLRELRSEKAVRRLGLVSGG